MTGPILPRYPRGERASDTTCRRMARRIACWALFVCLVPLLMLPVSCRNEQANSNAGAPTPSASHGASAPPQPSASHAATAHGKAPGSHSESPLAYPKVPPGPRPRVALLTASWCQWCQVLEHQVLSSPEIQKLLKQSYTFLHVDIDEAPSWMDLPGVQGLPTLAFFDRNGRHVLTRSGYRNVPELSDLLTAVAERIRQGELEPYPEQPALLKLSSETISKEAAEAALKRYEQRIFFKVNSNDGGFLSPSRHPYPDLLLELQLWSRHGAPARVKSWVDKTTASALRGRSPRLDGEPLSDLKYKSADLIELARSDPSIGKRWLEGLEHLPVADPFEGIQDPIDGGVFRYAAGPGWYHPHVERRALDNLAWILLLRERQARKKATRIAQFVQATFREGQLYSATQQANPFYYRLTQAERARVSAPKVNRLWLLKTQARAARVFKEVCASLTRVDVTRWPRAVWTEAGEDDDKGPATPDAVGELLLALSQCPDEANRKQAQTLSQTVVELWKSARIPIVTKPSRLSRLAAGLCAAGSPDCERALNTVTELELELEHPPPLAALAAQTRSAN